MANNTYNPAPGTTIDGINDKFTTAVAPSTEPRAFANSLFFTFAKKGIVDTGIWATGTALTNIYGDEVVDLNNKFTTHSTPFIQYANQKSCPIDVIRVVPSDIGPAPTLELFVEYMHDDIDTYQRDETTNKFLLGSDGKPIKLGTTKGLCVRFFTKPVEGGKLGQTVSKLGELTGTYGQSKIIPLFALQHYSQGSDGDNTGVGVWPVTADDSPDVTSAQVEETGFPFRLKVLRKTEASVTGNIVNTVDGLKYVEGSFQIGAQHPSTNADYDIFTLLGSQYSNLKNIDDMTFADIGTIHVYDAYVKELFDALNGYIGKENAYAVNPFTGIDFDGVPYDEFKLLDSTEGAYSFTEESSMFLSGGTDGTLSEEEFDKAVARYLEQVTAWDEHIITNMAKHPIKLTVDTGFSLDTKKKYIKFACGIMKAVTHIGTPQDVMLSDNSETMDTSTAKALAVYARSFPESKVYGTETCRYAQIGRTGKLAGTTYKKKVPFVYALFCRIIDEFGSPTGQINSNLIMQDEPQKNITEYISMSYEYQGATARQRDWDNGMMVIMPNNRRDYYIPAYRGVYAQPTSILSDIGNVIICVDTIHQLEEVFRELAGKVGFTQQQLITDANRRVASKTKAERYAGITTVTANCYLDSIDLNNKFSWHGDAIVAGSVPARNANISVTSVVRGDE